MTKQAADSRAGVRTVEGGPNGYSAFYPAPQYLPTHGLCWGPTFSGSWRRPTRLSAGLTASLCCCRTSQFIYTYVRKEAVLSSQIEGTVSSLSDLLLFEADEAPGVPITDARETANHLTGDQLRAPADRVEDSADLQSAAP